MQSFENPHTRSCRTDYVQLDFTRSAMRMSLCDECVCISVHMRACCVHLGAYGYAGQTYWGQSYRLHISVGYTAEDERHVLEACREPCRDLASSAWIMLGGRKGTYRHRRLDSRPFSTRKA